MVKTTKTEVDRIAFSFKYLDRSHFVCSQIFEEKPEIQAKYFIVLLERLKNLSTITFSELLQQQRQSPKTWRFHSVDWQETSQKNGFGLPNEYQLVDKPYQFSLSANEYGRVIGFFIRSTFYIVWLDYRHLVYSKK